MRFFNRSACVLQILTVALGVMPSMAYAVDARSIAQVIQTPSAQDQARMFEAVDAGDVQSVQAHVNFVRSFATIDPNSHGGVNLEFTDAAGNTPLIRAAVRPNMNVVQYLLAQGAQINAINARGESALIASYNAGYFKTAGLLLSQGASDPYNVAQHLQIEQARLQQQSVEQKVEAKNNIVWQSTAIVAGGAAIAATAIALGDNGGSSSHSAGNGISGSALTIDCGAGAGIHPEACNAADFNTSEAQQTGLLQMNANDAYARGYDGRIFNRDANGDLLDDVPDGHVLVAELDSGVDVTHPDLANNMVSGLAVTCTTSQGCVSGGTDIQGHGTNVAGVLAGSRNGVGMHGVAPEAHIIPISVIGVNQGSVILANKWANDHGAQIFNNSWEPIYNSLTDPKTVPIVTVTGGPTNAAHPAGTYTGPTATEIRGIMTEVEGGTTLLEQYQTAVAQDRIIVFANGNSSLSQPSYMAGLPYYFQGATAPPSETQNNYNIANPDHYDWSKNWVAVAAVDNLNAITSYSNRCGVAKDWCLVAPGNILSTTKNGGGYNSTQGTSFAAPNVTGSLAILLGAFPQLAPEDALQILFDTATDLGVAGVDDVYGHGLVNLEKATDPTSGGWSLTSAGAGGLSSFSFYNSGLGLSAPFGNAVAHNTSSLIFLDGYGKDYMIPISVLSGSLDSFKTSFDRYEAFGHDVHDTEVSLNDNTTLAFSASDTEGFDPTRATQPYTNFSLASGLPMGKDYASAALHYHMNLAEVMASDTPNRYSTVSAYENPYLRMAGEATSVVSGYRSGSLSTQVAAYAGRAETQDAEYRYHFDQTREVNGVMVENSYQPIKSTMMSLTNGVLVEQNSMLGSEMSGAFGIANSTTYHSGIGTRIALGDRIALFGNYNVGMTEVNAASSSLFTGFDRLTTNSFALGAEMTGIRNERDRVGFVFSQPLRVASGGANLNLPVDVVSGGGMLFNQGRMNLAPSGRELDMETYYHLKLDEDSEFGISGLLRFDPENNSDSGSDALVLAKYKTAL